LYRKMQDLDYLTRRLGQNVYVQLNNKKNNLTLKISRLDDLSPLATMRRGYSIFRDGDRTLVRSVKNVKPGDRVEVIVWDGAVECSVKAVQEGGYGKE